MSPKTFPLFGVLCLLLCSCATVRVGEFDLAAERWKEDERAIRARASIDLKCTSGLELRPISLFTGTISNIAEQVSVSGCGNSVIYVQTLAGWLRN